MTLLSKIKKLCQDNGNISINRLEKEAGLTRGSISKWDDHAPSYDKIKKVADYFGKTTEFFLSEGETKKAKSYLGLMPFSRQELIDQLLYEGFTQSQAEYGVSQNGY
jgi:DNA-binding helix-turn-helix protein